MKKLSILLAFVLAFALAMPVLANPGQNPNQNPGGPQLSAAPFTVVVRGGGNNLAIEVVDASGNIIYRPQRAGNGTFAQTIDLAKVGIEGFTIDIRVQGNSLIGAKATCTHVNTVRTATDATCTTDGSYVYNCVVCGDVTDAGTIPAVGCQWGAWNVETEATCNKEGYQSRLCTWSSVYGCYDSEVIPMLPCSDFCEGGCGACVNCGECGCFNPPTPPCGDGSKCGTVCPPCQSTHSTAAHENCMTTHHVHGAPGGRWEFCGCTC